MKSLVSVAFRTLVFREIKRFLKVYNQTLIAPIVTGLLYFVIFTVLFASRAEGNYSGFVACGIIIMSMLQNAYMNTQSTITTAKLLGFVVDFVIPPISIRTLLSAILIAGIVRGILVGLICLTVLSFFVQFQFYNLFLTLLYSVFACALFALFGIIIGALSKNFDTAASYNSYIIMPITFLSGTFYSIKFLPEFWQKVIYFNPVFYIIDGFRYSVIGVSEANLNQFFIISLLFVWTLTLGIISYFVMKKHYHEF